MAIVVGPGIDGRQDLRGGQKSQRFSLDNALASRFSSGFWTPASRSAVLRSIGRTSGPEAVAERAQERAIPSERLAAEQGGPGCARSAVAEAQRETLCLHAKEAWMADFARARAKRRASTSRRQCPPRTGRGQKIASRCPLLETHRNRQGQTVSRTDSTSPKHPASEQRALKPARGSIIVGVSRPT